MKKLDKVVWGMVGCGVVTEKKSGPGLYKSENSELKAVFDINYEHACDYAKDIMFRLYTRQWKKCLQIQKLMQYICQHLLSSIRIIPFSV